MHCNPKSSTMVDRRGFLWLGSLAAAAVAAPLRLFAEAGPEFDENAIVFLADVHAGAGKKCAVARAKFKETVSEILAMRPLPRNVLVFGDVAYTCGLGADYDVSRPLFKKLEDAGIVVTIGMGNHDRRSEYAKHWPEAAAKSLVPGRYVHLLETPHVDFLMLDSLQGSDDRANDDKGPVKGALSDDQQEFLRKFVAERSKPVVLCAHHKAGELSVCGEGMTAFMLKSPCVAGYIHGHNHRWRRDWTRDMSQNPPHRAKRELCLPSNGMWGDIGYALCRLKPDRIVIEPILKDFWVPRPVPKEQRPPEWDDLLFEARASGPCTIRLNYINQGCQNNERNASSGVPGLLGRGHGELRLAAAPVRG